jgi:hypothetical protein
MTAGKREPHEGTWMYVSLSHDERLEQGVTETCQRHGWPVRAATGERSERRLQALRFADACIVYVSSTSSDAGAELAFALCEERPVIAFSSGTGTRSPLIEDLVRDRPDVHQLSCDDVEDCMAALDCLLADPAWQEQVAQAAPCG